jgi:acyl carrier protein
MDPETLKTEIKRLIIAELDLRDKSEGDIADDAPLFGDSGGEGLGLDSLDALQLAMAIEDRFGVQIPEGEQARSIFASVSALAEHLAHVGA